MASIKKVISAILATIVFFIFAFIGAYLYALYLFYVYPIILLPWSIYLGVIIFILCGLILIFGYSMAYYIYYPYQSKTKEESRK